MCSELYELKHLKIELSLNQKKRSLLWLVNKFGLQVLLSNKRWTYIEIEYLENGISMNRLIPEQKTIKN